MTVMLMAKKQMLKIFFNLLVKGENYKSNQIQILQGCWLHTLIPNLHDHLGHAQICPLKSNYFHP